MSRSRVRLPESATLIPAKEKITVGDTVTRSDRMDSLPIVGILATRNREISSCTSKEMCSLLMGHLFSNVRVRVSCRRSRNAKFGVGASGNSKNWFSSKFWRLLKEFCRSELRGTVGAKRELRAGPREWRSRGQVKTRSNKILFEAISASCGERSYAVSSDIISRRFSGKLQRTFFAR